MKFELSAYTCRMRTLKPHSSCLVLCKSSVGQKEHRSLTRESRDDCKKAFHVFFFYAQFFFRLAGHLLLHHVGRKCSRHLQSCNVHFNHLQLAGPTKPTSSLHPYLSGKVALVLWASGSTSFLLLDCWVASPQTVSSPLEL